MSIMKRIYPYVNLLVVLLWISLVDVGSAQCSCYSFDGKYPRSWSAAKALCKDNNGELVSMETEGEWEFIKTQIQGKTTHENEWWIGLVKRNGEWKWLSNHSFTYDKWGPSQPETDEQKNQVKMAKDYPRGTYGLFANMKDYVKRGTICEYKKQVDCKNRVEWCPPTTTAPSRSTTILTSSTPIKPSQPVKKTSTDIGYSPTPTSTPTPSTLPTSLGKHTRKSFTTEIVASVVGALLVLTVCLLIFVCIWKRRRAERKPRRNSHLSKKSRVPVKLEQSESLMNANDLIDSTDVINMTGQTNRSSPFPVVNGNASQPEATYASLDSHNAGLAVTGGMSGGYAPLCACVSKTKDNDHKETRTDQSQQPDIAYANQHSYHGNKEPGNVNYDHENGLQVNSNEGIPSYEVTDPAAVYATVDKSSKTAVKDNTLQYAQLEDFQNEQQGTTKKPPPYTPTEYATIMEPIICKSSKSKEDLTQV